MELIPLKAPLIKLQKKGYPEVRKVPIEAAQTWGVCTTLFPPRDALRMLNCCQELRAVIRVLYAVSDEPQIVTFEGDLIRSNDDYARVLKPGLHLVVSYPSALTDLAFEFSRLFPAEYRWDRCPSKEKESTTSPSPGSSAIESLSEATRDHASPASSYGSPPDIPPRKSCHLQPPKLTFYPPKETRFHVTLANARFPDFGGDCGDAANAKHGSATGWAFESQPQEKRRRLLCSISWTFAASPANSHPAVLTDAVSNLARQTVGWAVSPDPPIAAAESSERRFYANCDGDGLGEQMCQGWWMAGETLLPASFAGEEGDRTLLLRGISHTEFFLTDFLKTCGVPGEELNVRPVFITRASRADPPYPGLCKVLDPKPIPRPRYSARRLLGYCQVPHTETDGRFLACQNQSSPRQNDQDFPCLPSADAGGAVGREDCCQGSVWN